MLPYALTRRLIVNVIFPVRLYRVYSPPVFHLSVKELEAAAVFCADAEAPPARVAALRLHLLDLQPRALPAQRHRPFGVRVPRVALDRVSAG